MTQWIRLAAIAAVLLIAATPAGASWRDTLKVLRVGFVAGDDPAAAATSLEPFRWRLQYELAVPVELFPARSYQALIEAESSGRIQYAILSALAFVELQRSCGCAEPLVQPTASDGGRGFRALLVARTHGPVRTLAEAKGMRLAAGARDSISGRLAPFAGLAGEGIEPGSYFAEIIERADGLATLRSLRAGEADLALTWSTAADPLAESAGSGPIARLAEAGEMPPGGLTLVWQSELVPFGPHAIRTDMPEEAKAALLRALTSLDVVSPEAYDAVEKSLGGGFVAADPILYRRLAEWLSADELR